MAIKLGELLVQKGMVTTAQVTEALRAQDMFGGRLGSNLVELGYLSEQALAQFLSIQLNIPCAEMSELENIGPEALKLIPKEIAAKYKAVPLRLEKRRLRLAIADPTDIKAVDEIGFLTACSIQPVVAPEMLITYVLERYYGIKRATRFIRVSGAPETDFQVVQSTQANALDGVESSLGKNVQLEDRAQFLTENTGSSFGSHYTFSKAMEDLAAITEQRQAFDILKKFESEHYAQTAFFVLRGEAVSGWACSGCAINDTEIVKVAFALNDSRLAAHVAHSKATMVGSLENSATDGWLAKTLSIANPQQVLAMPVVVNGQMVAFMLACGPKKGRLEDRLSEIEDVAKRTSYALQMVFLRKRILQGG